MVCSFQIYLIGKYFYDFCQFILQCLTALYALVKYKRCRATPSEALNMCCLSPPRAPLPEAFSQTAPDP